MKSKLTKSQKKVYSKRPDDDEIISIKAIVRYDDKCGNGHNSFSITADIKHRGGGWSCGCCHDEVVKYFPELEKYIKWHLVDSDKPTWYIENTMYHVLKHDALKAWCKGTITENGVSSSFCEYGTIEEMQAIADKCKGLSVDIDEKTAKVANLDAARRCAIWPEATDEELTQEPDALKAQLIKRLPALMKEFKTAVESLGFTY